MDKEMLMDRMESGNAQAELNAIVAEIRRVDEKAAEMEKHRAVLCEHFQKARDAVMKQLDEATAIVSRADRNEPKGL